MKILYITSMPLEYSSSGNLRNIALIRGLINNGHSVTTLTTKPQKNSECFDETLLNLNFEKRYFLELGKLHTEISATGKNTVISKLKGPLYRLYTKFNMYDSRKQYAAHISQIDFCGEKFDIVISSSDPKSSHLFAERLLKVHPGIADRWIQYWGDPFTGDINRRSMVPDFVVAKEEKRLLSLCDKAVYVSPLTCEYIKKKYPEYSEKVHFVPVGYSAEKIYPKHENSELNVCYCGDYNSKDRNLKPLIDAVEQLSGKCRLTLAGNTDLHFDKKENISVYPRVEKKKVDEFEEKSDVIACVCNRSGTQIPGKIYHASATNRAVLILLDGENKDKIKEYFEKYNRFIFCQNTKEEIIKTLKTLDANKLDAKPCTDLNGRVVAKEIIS